MRRRELCSPDAYEIRLVTLQNPLKTPLLLFRRTSPYPSNRRVLSVTPRSRTALQNAFSHLCQSDSHCWPAPAPHPLRSLRTPTVKKPTKDAQHPHSRDTPRSYCKIESNGESGTHSALALSQAMGELHKPGCSVFSGEVTQARSNQYNHTRYSQSFRSSDILANPPAMRDQCSFQQFPIAQRAILVPIGLR